MQISFIVNAVLSIGIILVPTCINLLRIRKHSINFRLALLGLSCVIVILLLSLEFPVFFHLTLLLDTCRYASCWLTGLFYLSFLMDLTSVRRPRYFFLVYALPLLLGIVCAVIPGFHVRLAIFACGIAIGAYFSFSFIFSWIQAATDDRAKRDGQWMLMVFIAFFAGFIVCLFRVRTGVFWVMAIWYLVLHIAVNMLKILQQLTDPENLLIIDNVSDIIVILDGSGRIVRINRRGLQLSGYPASGINGWGIEKLIMHKELSGSRRLEWLDSFGGVDQRDGAVSVGGRSPSIDANLLTRLDGSIPVDLHVLCLSGLGKERTGYILSAADMRITRQLMKEISDREYATRDLALSESKFSRMFVFNPTGILIIDLDTFRITDANPAIEEIFECDSSVLAGKTLSDIGLEMSEMTHDNFFEKVQMEGSVPEFSAKIRLGAQRVRRCRLSAVTFDFNSKRNMLLSVADVTQQDQMREALERKQKVETVGILAGGIAHDFNNILAVILGHIGLAKMRVVDPHARAPIEKAEQACLRAREMTRQLLAFSRGGKPVIGLCETTRQLIIDSAMLAVSDTSVACLFDVEKEIWPLMVDKIQIGQVITNLVKNSVDMMDKGGIIEIMARNRDLSSVGPRKRPVGIDSKPLESGMYVEIRISDQGPGIPEAIRDKIFDPFFTTKEKGTGLGLSIVFSVIQNHKGSINVISHEGEGAVFSVYLPAGPVAAGKEANPELAAISDNKKVLVMDDEKLVLDTASGILSSFGFDVTATSNGDEAILRYREALDRGEPYAFCILDLIIPDGMSGTECARAILDLDPGALLIVSSGYSDDPVLAHFRDYGFAGIIPKPYTVEEFRQSLARVLVL